MIFAIRLSDLAILPEFHPLRFLLGPVLTERLAFFGSQFDAVGVVLECDDAERLDAILRVATSQNLPGLSWPIRTYKSTTGAGAWRRWNPTEETPATVD